jgi:PAS domain S-box-containing protein
MSDNLFTQLTDENTSKFEAVFTNNSEAMALSCQGILLLCNQSFLTTFGYSSGEEIIGKSVLTLIAPEAQEDIKDYIAKRTKNEPIPKYYETIGIRKDGSPFDFEISSSNYTYNGEVHSIVIGRNITEKKRIQKELIQSEEKFRIAFQSNPSIVGISTLDQGKYLEIIVSLPKYWVGQEKKLSVNFPVISISLKIIQNDKR